MSTHGTQDGRQARATQHVLLILGISALLAAPTHARQGTPPASSALELQELGEVETLEAPAIDAEAQLSAEPAYDPGTDTPLKYAETWETRAATSEKGT